MFELRLGAIPVGVERSGDFVQLPAMTEEATTDDGSHSTGTNEDRLGELLKNQLMSLDRIRSCGRKRGSLQAVITVKGEEDDLPSHVIKIAERFGLTVLHRDTQLSSIGIESRFEITTDERVERIQAYEEDRGIEDQATVVHAAG